MHVHANRISCLQLCLSYMERIVLTLFPIVVSCCPWNLPLLPQSCTIANKLAHFQSQQHVYLSILVAKDRFYSSLRWCCPYQTHPLPLPRVLKNFVFLNRYYHLRVSAAALKRTGGQSSYRGSQREGLSLLWGSSNLLIRLYRIRINGGLHKLTNIVWCTFLALSLLLLVQLDPQSLLVQRYHCTV